MNPRERELLQGMVNCFHVCHANFADTVGMVGSARGLAPEEVIEILNRLREADGEEYKKIRIQLPADFPL
jgi:dihydrodipicolinate synthase/N-acetylneuraminate lyase